MARRPLGLGELGYRKILTKTHFNCSQQITAHFDRDQRWSISL